MTSFTFSFEKSTLMQGGRSNFEIAGGGHKTPLLTNSL